MLFITLISSTRYRYNYATNIWFFIFRTIFLENECRKFRKDIESCLWMLYNSQLFISNRSSNFKLSTWIYALCTCMFYTIIITANNYFGSQISTQINPFQVHHFSRKFFVYRIIDAFLVNKAIGKSRNPLLIHEVTHYVLSFLSEIKHFICFFY